jgi:hypothetical protein
MNLHIELNVDADPIEGHLHAENDDGRPVGDEDGRPFCGWIELTRAIELGLAAARRVPAPNADAPAQPEITDRPS